MRLEGLRSPPEPAPGTTRVKLRGVRLRSHDPPRPAKQLHQPSPKLPFCASRDPRPLGVASAFLCPLHASPAHGGSCVTREAGMTLASPPLSPTSPTLGGGRRGRGSCRVTFRLLDPYETSKERWSHHEPPSSPVPSLSR